jgi:hypothetical protein
MIDELDVVEKAISPRAFSYYRHQPKNISDLETNKFGGLQVRRDFCYVVLP